MEGLKSRRTVTKSQFTRAEKQLVEALKKLDAMPVATLERRYADLNSKWSQAQDAHDEYVAAITDPTDAKAEEVWIEEVAERFYQIELLTDQAIQDKKRQAECDAFKVEPVEGSLSQPGGMQDQAAVIKNSESPRSSLQIERIKLEKFNGDIRKYPKFREQFELYVQPQCLTSQLPFVLRAHLTDDVKEDVDNEDDNMDTLWTRLDKKYGNRGKQVDAILADLAKAPKGGSQSTLQMIKVVEKAYRDLHRMSREAEMENGTMLSLIEKKLPEEIRFEWIEKIAEMTEEGPKEKLNIMLALLQKWKHMIEYDQSAIRKIPEKRLTSLHTSGSVRNKGPERVNREGCWIHTAEKHPIWVCQAFKAKPVAERLELVKSNKACEACLEVKCPGSENPSLCKRKFKCTLEGCNKLHNRLLHQ